MRLDSVGPYEIANMLTLLTYKDGDIICATSCLAKECLGGRCQVIEVVWIEVSREEDPARNVCLLHTVGMGHSQVTNTEMLFGSLSYSLKMYAFSPRSLNFLVSSPVFQPSDLEHLKVFVLGCGGEQRTGQSGGLGYSFGCVVN